MMKILIALCLLSLGLETNGQLVAPNSQCVLSTAMNYAMLYRKCLGNNNVTIPGPHFTKQNQTLCKLLGSTESSYKSLNNQTISDTFGLFHKKVPTGKLVGLSHAISKNFVDTDQYCTIVAHFLFMHPWFSTVEKLCSSVNPDNSKYQSAEIALCTYQYERTYTNTTTNTLATEQAYYVTPVVHLKLNF